MQLKKLFSIDLLSTIIIYIYINGKLNVYKNATEIIITEICNSQRYFCYLAELMTLGLMYLRI